eukprot:420768-Pleurochrysis_carterae.AAC.1
MQRATWRFGSMGLFSKCAVTAFAGERGGVCARDALLLRENRVRRDRWACGWALGHAGPRGWRLGRRARRRVGAHDRALQDVRLAHCAVAQLAARRRRRRAVVGTARRAVHRLRSVCRR